MDYNKFRLYLLDRDFPQDSMVDCLDYIDSVIGFNFFIELHSLGWNSFYSNVRELRCDIRWKILLRNYCPTDHFGYSSWGSTPGWRFYYMFRFFYYQFKHKYNRFLSC